MKDVAIVAAVLVGGVLLLKVMSPSTAAMPTGISAQTGAQSTTNVTALNGYGSLAAGIGTGLGSFMTGISSLISSTDTGNGYDD